MKLTKYTIIVFLLIVTTGCASLYVPPLPQYSLPKNAQIGLLVTASEFPKHTHVGTTVFNNFAKDYEYQWRMEEFIFNEYKQEIEKSTGFSVVNLRDLGVENAAELNFVGVKDKQWSLIEGNSQLRDTLIEKGIYAVVSISEVPTLASLECSQFGCTEHYSQGYGLFTRSFLGIDRYMASASFSISVEIINPLADIAVQKGMRDILRFSNKNKIISDFKDPEDFKNISEQELSPIKNEILSYIKSVAAATSRYLSGSLTDR
ncbi:MAG: hypothetical protein KUG81_05275 [Gammaproteobacteria bacterium]|nr:hypothetical protein [Gammaproteobacteria bacterium]